jgi:hypothetical protein
LIGENVLNYRPLFNGLFDFIGYLIEGDPRGNHIDSSDLAFGLSLKPRYFTMNQSALLRPDWTPATIALMILGFVVFWPLGLAMLAYILFGDRLRGFKRDINEATDGMFAGCRRGPRGRHRSHFTSDNVVFDDWRKAELDRLEQERRKLDEMRAEFDTYVRELRRAKDQDEFDRFMRERNNVKRDDNGPAAEFQTP